MAIWVRMTMFEQAFNNIEDVLWKDIGCTSELDYTEQSSWLLFLKYLAAIYERTLAALAALKKSLLHQAFTGGFDGLSNRVASGGAP